MKDFPHLPLPVPNDWDRKGLPAWTYHSDEVMALERDKLFRTHWQLIGHDCDLPNVGDWLTFDLLGERALVIRGQDGEVRAFHNLCRHRGARVVDGVQGHCKGALVCPFHGWVYNMDGSLRGPSQPQSFGGLDRAQFGLKEMELQTFHGFLFIRFQPGPQPPVAEWLAAYDADFAAYGAEKMQPADVMSWSADLEVNWKSVRDVDNEGYHVALAHPGLQELYGRTYRDINLAGGLNVSVGYYGDAPGRSWSVRNYLKFSDPDPSLPRHLQSAWTYYGVFPNAVFAFTPEGMQFYQELPLDKGNTHLTGRLYRRAEESRRQRAARYLAMRIDRDTSAEDRQLSIWSNESMKSSAFEGFHLSDLEWGLSRHHDGLRAVMPVLTLPHAPPEGSLAIRNAEMICATAPAD